VARAARSWRAPRLASSRPGWLLPVVTRAAVPGGEPGARLRPYQAEAVETITPGLRDGGRGQVRMACGTGKTLVAARAAAQVTGRGGVIVLLVPSIALAAQMIAAWPAGCPVDRVLAVCSDHTVGGGGVRASSPPLALSRAGGPPVA